MRFLDESRIKDLSPIVENSKYSSSIVPEISSIHFEPERRKPTKSIKNRVVKDINNLELEITEVKGCKTDREGLRKYDPNTPNHLFTNPKLLKEIQNDLKAIASNRNSHPFKENYPSCNL